MQRIILKRVAARRARYLFAALTLLFVLAIAWVIHWRSNRASPQLTTPMLALDRVSAKSLYYNGAAHPWLVARRPDLLAAEERAQNPQERRRKYIQAAENPKLFRQLDRQYRFDTLLLVGDPGEYRPLLEHLVETKDWTLTYLDHTSLVYKRSAARAWTPKELELVREKLGSRREQAIFLAQAATKMLALHMTEPAIALLDDAEKLDVRAAEIWSARAIYHMNRAEWTQALADADRALDLAPEFLPALSTKTQVLYATKKLKEALALSKRLIEARPEVPALLFYHAKIAHEMRAFAEEIAALERLIAIAERESQPVSGYRIYLAQAYAADGQAAPSIAQFQLALADAELPKEQRRFAEETLAQIKQRSGL